MKLLDNGLDSFKKSIHILKDLNTREVDENYEYKLKDLVVSLHHSIETLFKYLIREKNEYLVYEKIEDIFRYEIESKFNTNKKKLVKNTIQFIDAINRVITLYDIDISKEDYDKFKALNDLRNSLTHYEIEFKDKEVEHLITILLPILLSIYGSNIENFKEYAQQNNLYYDVNNITMNTELWTIQRYCNLIKKINKSKDKITFLRENLQERKIIFESKEKNIKYMKCSICDKELFHATGTYILDYEEIKYLGECKYCGFNLDKLDAQFMSLYYNEFEIANKIFITKMIKVIKDILESNDEELKNEINIVFSNDSDIIIDIFKYWIGYEIDDIIRIASSKYFEENIYFYNDIFESTVEFSESKVMLEYNEIKYYLDKEDLKIQIRKSIDILDSVKTVNSDIFESLKEYLSTTYLSYHQGSYIDGNGEEHDCEITIEVAIKFEDLIDSIQYSN